MSGKCDEDDDGLFGAKDDTDDTDTTDSDDMDNRDDMDDEFGEVHDFGSEPEIPRDKEKQQEFTLKNEEKTIPESEDKGSVKPTDGDAVALKEQGSEPDKSLEEGMAVNGSKRKVRIPLSKNDKAVRLILRRAGLEKVPELSVLMAGKTGTPIRIGDIGLFTGTPEDELLSELAKQFTVKNTVNLSAEVSKARVLAVAAQILEANRMFQPIHVAQIRNADGTYEIQCTSGRHRVAGLGLLYGPDVEIPVYFEEMTINQARDAVVVANQARPAKALEKAEHAVLRAVSGNADARQDEIYTKTVKAKPGARKYCSYSVVERKYPVALGFPVSTGTASRKGGDLTTLANIELFWGSAIGWEPGMEREAFDKELKDSVVFLNRLVNEMKAVNGFDSAHHLAAMTLTAIGKFYKTSIDLKQEVPDTTAMAKAVVSLGEIGRQKPDATFRAIAKAMGK